MIMLPRLAESSQRLVIAGAPVSKASRHPMAAIAEVRVMGFFEAAFLCAVALVMITAIQIEN
jgi:hypothetical protein